MLTSRRTQELSSASLVVTGAPENRAVPRDNVLFEAGYFIQAKGKDRVLIVREAGAKMPADLGGMSTPR
jgi:predicted nucleotide-binding protein